MYRNIFRFFLIVIIILALIFVPTLCFDRTLKKDVSEMNELIEEISNDINMNKKAIIKCKSLTDMCNKKMKIWSFIVHHGTIEKIQTEMITFVESIENGDKNAANVSGKKIKKLLNITSKQDELSLSNLL